MDLFTKTTQNIPMLSSLREKLFKNRSNLAKRFVSGISWNVIATFVGRGFGILSSIVLARLLGRVGYGELGIIQSTMHTVGFVLGATMSETATKFLAQYRETNALRAGNIMALCWLVALTVGGLSTGLVFSLAPWLSGTILKAPQLTPYLRWGSLLILFNVLTGVQRGMLIGLEEFKRLALLTILFGFLTLPFILLLTWQFNLAGAISASLILQCLQWLANSYYLRRALSHFRIRVNFREVWSERRILWRFSLPYVMGGLLYTPVEWICNALLVRQSDGLAQMGVFLAAYRWKQFILFIPNAASSVSTAIHAERLERKDYRSVRKVFWISFLLVTGLALGGALLIGVASPFILRQYGPGFVETGVPVMLFVLGASALQAMTVPSNNLVVSSGKIWQGFGIRIFTSLTLITMTYSLVHRGAIGLSMAHLGGNLVCFFLLMCLTLPMVRRV